MASSRDDSVSTAGLSRQPLLVAIVGGSGSGKSYVAEALQQRLGEAALRVALDNFYRDRSHLSPRQRARVNYDHPRAIDWALFREVLNGLAQNRSVEVPYYDFCTHSRTGKVEKVEPRTYVLVEGLWLLRSPAVRKLFGFRVYLECPRELRLQRRLARDVANRGRSLESIQEQFERAVEPMHCRFVECQRAWADLVLPPERTPAHLDDLVRRLQKV